MNALVVYDSQCENTERIARAIADELRELGRVRIIRVDSAHPAELQGVDAWQRGGSTSFCRATIATGDLKRASL